MAARQKFHFASRLYLWQQLPQAAGWLDELRPTFTGGEQPLPVLLALLGQPLPPLLETAGQRQPHFERYPRLRHYERVLFRLLYLQTVYGYNSLELFGKVLPKSDSQALYQRLQTDRAALLSLSSYAINFVYLFSWCENRVGDWDSRPQQFLEIAQTGFTASTPLKRQLEAYFYTHCIIAESLFYARPVSASRRTPYLAMLLALEKIIETYFETIKLDILYEYLVCCRILGRPSHLVPRIMLRTENAIHPEGFIAEPLSPVKATLQNSEHRNVLFLLAQHPYQPLFRA